MLEVKEANHLEFSRVSNILSVVWTCSFPNFGLALQGPDSRTSVLYLLAIDELLPDEKYDDVEFFEGSEIPLTQQ
jgi:hypothetical protein